MSVKVATNDERARWEGVSEDVVEIGFVVDNVVIEVDDK